jgi:hypothetical protein
VKGITHPFSRALYEQDGTGHVRVTDTEGRVGTYAVDGKWVSGAKLDIDPHLIGWVGGPKVAHHRVAVDEH